MLHFLRGTMVSLGVGSVENWAVPLYQGQLTVISDVSKGCWGQFHSKAVVWPKTGEDKQEGTGV